MKTTRRDGRELQETRAKEILQRHAIHRAFPHILVQMGDPLSRRKDRSAVGTGGPGYTLPPEIRRKHDQRRRRRGASAGQDQSLARLQRQPVLRLPRAHAEPRRPIHRFRPCDLGLWKRSSRSAAPVDSNDNPVERVEIRSVKIVPREIADSAGRPRSPVLHRPKHQRKSRGGKFSAKRLRLREGARINRPLRRAGRYRSGQTGRTVNPLAYAFTGSNPVLPTLWPRPEIPDRFRGKPRCI